MTQKTNHVYKIFCHHQIFFLKNTFKVALQYLLNILILINIVFNLELNFKLKMRTLKTLKKFGKPGKSFEKTSGNPDKYAEDI